MAAEAIRKGPPGPTGPAGAVGADGPDGAQGPPGEDVPPFEHIQGSAAADWPIPHNLGTYPDPLALDSLNREIEGEVEYVSPDLLIIHFSAVLSGRAYLPR